MTERMGFACQRCGPESACDPYFHLKLLAGLTPDSWGSYFSSALTTTEKLLIGISGKTYAAPSTEASDFADAERLALEARAWLSADRLLEQEDGVIMSADHPVRLS